VSRSITITQLRANPGRIIRLAREMQESVDITLRGEVVARLVPGAADEDSIWAEIDELAAEIGRDWQPKGMSAAEAIREGRR